MVDPNYFDETKKHCTLKKKNGSLRLNIVTHTEKKGFFWNNYSTLDHSLSYELLFHKDFCNL